MPYLSQEFVTKAEPGEYRDDELHGFVLRVSKTGVKSYQVHNKVRGQKKPIRYVIGKHGKPWSNAKARKEATSILMLMRQGVDPRTLVKEERAKEAAEVEAEETLRKQRKFTLMIMLEDWLGSDENLKASTQKLYRWVVSKHLKDWLEKPLVDITPEMVIKRYDFIAKSSASSAHNTFAALSKLFTWTIAEKDGIVSANPAREIAKRGRKRKLKPRETIIENQDLAKWFAAVEQISSPVYRDFFVFVLLNGLRKSEAASLRWENVKAEEFVCRDTKNKTDHWLPITPINRALLARCAKRGKTGFVFAGKSSTGHINDVRYWTDKVIKLCNVDFTAHPLRRTFSLVAARVRISEAERKKLLNHINKADVTQMHYTPMRGAIELMEPLTLVQERLLELCGATADNFKVPEESAKVVPIESKRLSGG